MLRARYSLRMAEPLPYVFDQDTVPIDYAGMAGVPPEVAAQLPDAVLRAIALSPSYTEGQKIPVRRDYGEPARDPAGRESVGAWETMLDFYRMNGILGTEGMRRGGPVREKRRAAVGALTLTAIQHAARRELMRRGLIRGALASGLHRR